MAPQKSEVLQGSALATLLGVHAPTVSKWKADGCPHRVQSGRPMYIVREVVKWLREQAAAESRSDVPEKAVEEARKLRAQADLAEMERDERVGLLVHRQAVEKAQLAENIRTRSILLAAPGTYATDVANDLGVSVRNVAHVIERTMRSILEQLSDETDDVAYRDTDFSDTLM